MDWQPLRAASWSSSWVSPCFHPDYKPWKHLGFLPAVCKITHTPHNAQPHLLSHGIINTSTFHPSSSCSEKQVAARRGETRTDIRNEAARERARGCVCVRVGATCASSSRGDEGLSLKQIMKEKEATSRRLRVLNSQSSNMADNKHTNTTFV